MPKLRVYWIPQVPMKAFHVPVSSLREARLILRTLADYDIFQFENRVKPDYCNAGGLDVFDPEDDHDGPDGSWCTWYDEDDRDIDHLTDEEIAAIDAAQANATQPQES